jgi:hypothetical protein
MTDWVTERSQCSPALVFEKLKSDIEKDVKLRNAILPSGSPYAFRLDISSDHLIVLLDGVAGNHSVALSLSGKFIIATSSNGNLREIFKATLTLDENQECKLKINGTEHNFWRVRQMLLEDLFFNIV